MRKAHRDNSLLLPMGTRASTHRRRATQIPSQEATEARATMEEQVQATKRAEEAEVEATPLRVTIRAQATQSKAPPTMRVGMAITITLRVRVATVMAKATDKANPREMREATMEARVITPLPTTKGAEVATTIPTHTTISEQTD